jgi:hypothetical protein
MLVSLSRSLVPRLGGEYVNELEGRHRLARLDEYKR